MIYTAGQKVVCINDEDAWTHKGFQLLKGKIYTILKMGPNAVFIKEDPTGYGWMRSRFKEAPKHKKNLPEWW